MRTPSFDSPIELVIGFFGTRLSDALSRWFLTAGLGGKGIFLGTNGHGKRKRRVKDVSRLP